MWTRKDTAALLAIIVAALGIRLVLVMAVQPPPVSDFGWYYARAMDIARGAGYTVNGHPTAFWPPGWPYFLAAVIKAFGPQVFAGEVVQAVLNTITVALVFLIARKIAGRACAIAGAASYAILPSAVEWCATLASEPLYTMLWALVTYIWVTRTTRQTAWFAFSGLLLGAAALVRPSALFFWVILLLYLLTIREERRHLTRIASAVAVTVMCTIVVIAPAIIRDYRIFGTFVLISNNGGLSLYQGNNPLAGGGYSDFDDPRVTKLEQDPDKEASADQLAERYAIAYMKSHPLHELWLAVRKIKSLYTGDTLVIRFTLRADEFREPLSPPPTDRLATSVAAVNNIFYYAFMVFAVAGVLLCIIKRGRTEDAPQWRLLLGMILYNTAIFAIVGGIDRYRYPTMPFFAVFAGIGLVAALALTGKRYGLRILPLRVPSR